MEVKGRLDRPIEFLAVGHLAVDYREGRRILGVRQLIAVSPPSGSALPQPWSRRWGAISTYSTLSTASKLITFVRG